VVESEAFDTASLARALEGFEGVRVERSEVRLEDVFTVLVEKSGNDAEGARR
jgi:hypothetical protein